MKSRLPSKRSSNITAAEAIATSPIRINDTRPRIDFAIDKTQIGAYSLRSEDDGEYIPRGEQAASEVKLLSWIFASCHVIQ